MLISAQQSVIVQRTDDAIHTLGLEMQGDREEGHESHGERE